MYKRQEAWRLGQIRARCSNLTALAAFESGSKKFVPMEGENDQASTAAIETAAARDQSKQLALMSLYGQRTQRAYEKYRKELEEVQAKRKAREANELEEARLLFQLADTRGLAYDPKRDGFVLSCAFLKAHAIRHHELLLARKTEGDFRKKHNLREIGRAAGKAA